MAYASSPSNHTTPTTTRPPIIKPNNTILFVCDIQDTFRGKIFNWPELVHVSTGLMRVAKALDMQIIVTEQQPFKPTIDELDISGAHSDKILLYKKTKFSMVCSEVQQFLSKNYVHENIVLCGLETHVCVLQTCLELLRMKYNVFVVVDSVGSQRQSDHTVALQRLQSEGVKCTTSESLIYELLGDAKHDKFKAILPIVKELAKFKSGRAVAPQT